MTDRQEPATDSPVHAAELHDIGVEGSDMTRDIHVALFHSASSRPARRSLPDVSAVLYEDVGRASDMAQPGGFRRGHVLADASPPAHAHASFLDSLRRPVRAGRNAVQASYDDFILANLGYGMSREDLYGADSGDPDDDDDANTPLVRYRVQPAARSGHAAYKSFSEADAAAADDATVAAVSRGGASVRKTVFTVLKSFVGSGVLFLPKAFQNGGMLFSLVGLSVSAALSTLCMLRLTACSNAVRRGSPNNHSISSGGGVSYGRVGERAFGAAGRVAVNVSLVLSQLGFCCSYLIFVEKNVGGVLAPLLPTRDAAPWTLLLLQVPLYTPLTWVRRLEYFALTNLVADVLILGGLAYILGVSVRTLEAAAAPPTWENFNARSWALFLGTAVYCFEGIGLVLPIYDAMDPKVQPHFPRLLALCILFLVALFSLFAGVVYAAFGQDTQSVVTLNLPAASTSSATVAVQLTYSLALVLTYPLMLYPVVKILESYVFAHRRVKGYWRWQKNAFRFALVCLTAAIAYFGKDQLDNFVALIGGFCSVPLAFIYPCLFHSKLVNNGHALNAAVIVIGALTMLFATYQALATWS
ncbi:hypothetical protein PybrP1_013189 [[Pythium] brassicae (nom. inval.)]|nr:hypothetical protein PybrP1_013189 [[Pythium] brassicae (nom. inval.)]